MDARLGQFFLGVHIELGILQIEEEWKLKMNFQVAYISIQLKYFFPLLLNLEHMLCKVVEYDILSHS